MKSPLTFVKIVATPTADAWSQAYNAGNLAAVLSLMQAPVDNLTNEDAEEAELSLPALGKELINTLEAEYFTLETKNLTTIKQALATTAEKATGLVTISFSVAVIMENVVYLCIYGKGKIIMKRGDKLGTLLEHDENNTIAAASGFIQHGDIIVLETPQFLEIVPADTLLPCLEHNKLAEMAEILAPVIHDHQEGGAAAIAFSYQDEALAQEETEAQQPLPLHEEPEKLHTASEQELAPEAAPVVQQPRLKKRRIGFPLTHTQRLFLTIALIVLAVLIGSIFFSLQKVKDTKIQELFTATVIPAQKKYEEGQSLLDLNKNLAQSDFQQAHDMLIPVQNKFPPDSEQAKQVTGLLAKITDALAGTQQASSNQLKQVDNTVSSYLAIVSKHATAPVTTQDDKSVYIADAIGITAITKADNKETVIVKNAGDWKSPGGLGTYLGNFYLLDTQGGIIKYVPTGASFSKSNYFPASTTPDLSKATSIAIDGSIWILGTDGLISKYTKGKQDQFSLKSLDKPLKKPAQIITTADDANIYVLDTGNNRVIVFDKTGMYIAQYQADVIGSAKAFDVDEKNKKIYILSASVIYEVDLK